MLSGWLCIIILQDTKICRIAFQYCYLVSLTGLLRGKIPLKTFDLRSIGVTRMTRRTVSDQRLNNLQFRGHKLDDADAWLQILKDDGLTVKGNLSNR